MFTNQDRIDNAWKHFTFEYFYKGVMEELTLSINPENFSQTEPARITVTQTKGGMFVDHFGAGVTTITIAGTTGYKHRVVQVSKDPNFAELESGQQEFLRLRKMYRDWMDNSTDPTAEGVSNPNPAQMRFHNWADNESYLVAINTFTLQRAVGRPLLYQYNIQLTVIRPLDEQEKRIEPDVTDMLGDKDRNSIFYNNLNNSLGYFVNVSKGVIPNLSDAMLTFANNLNKGLQYFDNALGVLQPITTVFSQIGDFTRNLGMVVNGIAKFISTPFDLVTGFALSIEDIIESLSCVFLIPHEAIRALRDLQCALLGIPESLFVGFINPELFEGASNCGTTLGIPPAPVAIYPNSFSATAQLPAEREAIMIFLTPTRTLTLKEIPTKVIGVFVETDLERTGNNYLDSYTGNQVKLTAVPTVPVYVVYAVQQSTTQNMIQLETASAYVVQKGDTLTRIALNFYGDASRWKEIAVYNKLEYPYIMDDLDFDEEIHATGTVRFFRVYDYIGDIIIPKDTEVYVPASNAGTNAIYFDTIEEIVLPAGQEYIDVSVQARLPGDIGNVAPNTITGIDVLTGSIENINNLSPTLGGNIWKVAIPGDIIFIPSVVGQKMPAIASSGKGYAELFGIDIKLNASGEIDTGAEQASDFSRVAGVPNLSQALSNRLKTGRGYYPYNPTYGSQLSLYIGRKGTYNWFTRVEKEIVFTMLDDKRIRNVRNLTLTIEGDSITGDFNAVTIAEQGNLPINVVV